jgi:hypothetical protein
MKSYYSNGNVRSRMLEYLGGNTLDTATCEYLTAGDETASQHRSPLPVNKLPELWAGGLDIGRSLWDRESLLFHLDIEYVNFDSPGDPLENPTRMIELLQHVEWVVRAVLHDYGIKPLHLLSGRGHHYVWQIPRRSSLCDRITRLGSLPVSLQELYARPHRPHRNPIEKSLGKAFFGEGLLLEYVAHRIKEMAAPMCEIPVELTAVEVGPTHQRREMISIDISEYGDPLSTRVIRVPFSVYLKPQQQRRIIGNQIVDKLPRIFLIPLIEIDSAQGITIMRDTARVLDLAATTVTRIPDQLEGTEELLQAYRNSSLAEFHRWFYSKEAYTRESWPETYDTVSFDNLPPCARWILEHPNDLLLKPAGIERIVRVLLSLGWHPRHISGLIRSKFERDHGWGDQWKGYDPATRAEFYTRVFTGLFAVGRDDLVDFNCQSAREEQFCFVSRCPFNLEPFKQSLLDRRTYERLGCGPFNRLFLPKEHL